MAERLRALPDAAVLDAARFEGDVQADALARALGRDVWAFNRVLAAVTTNESPLPASVPAHVRPLLVPALPDWADPLRIRRAQAFAQQHLVPITVGLFCASLPASYLAARGAQVLDATGRMHGDIDQRVNETARFVLDVLAAGGFDPGGRARVVVGKVRLVHAGVRTLVGAAPDGEVPINQEDMAGTILLFSTMVLRALVRLGVPVQPREREDFVHLWCAVGEMLGVRRDLLPADAATAEHLLDCIRARQLAPSDQGRRLMAALLEGLERHVAVPWLQQSPRVLVRVLLGDVAADALGLPPHAGRSWLGGRLREDAVLSALARRLAPGLGRRLLETVTLVKLHGAAPSFAIPTRLRTKVG